MKRKQYEQLSTPGLDRLKSSVDLSRLSNALIKLHEAASSQFGGDCFSHAAIAQKALALLGVKTRIAIGEAAWRVGPGDIDVVAHVRSQKHVIQAPSPVTSVGVPYAFHVWLTTPEGVVLDFTTYQLHAKAKAIDSFDGGSTNVAWCPPYLAAPAAWLLDFKTLLKTEENGCFYKEDSGIRSFVLARGSTIDLFDVEMAMHLYLNPDTQVFGPRTISAGA